MNPNAAQGTYGLTVYLFSEEAEDCMYPGMKARVIEEPDTGKDGGFDIFDDIDIMACLYSDEYLNRDNILPGNIYVRPCLNKSERAASRTNLGVHGVAAPIKPGAAVARENRYRFRQRRGRRSEQIQHIVQIYLLPHPYLILGPGHVVEQELQNKGAAQPPALYLEI